MHQYASPVPTVCFRIETVHRQRDAGDFPNRTRQNKRSTGVPSMRADTVTSTRRGDRWFAIDEEPGLTASGGTRQQALDSLDAAVEGGPSDDRDTVAIVKTPEVLHGKPRIDGTRLGVFLLGESVRRGGQTVDDLLEAYPELTEHQVEVALAYYDTHPDEMAMLRDEEAKIVGRIREESRAP